MLAASGHLTDRVRELIRLVGLHRVLATGQLAARAFGDVIMARHPLAVLVRLGMLRWFRPLRDTDSAPWRYVLGPIGAAMLGVEDRDEKKWAPRVRADRQRSLERSQRLGHMTGANWFFVALVWHARQGAELCAWFSEQETAERFYASTWEAEHRPHPDGMGIWAQGGRDICFFLEYDTGTEHLRQPMDKLPGYTEMARTDITFKVRSFSASPRRAASSPPARRWPPRSRPVASRSPLSRSTRARPVPPAARRGCRCTAGTARCGSSTWATRCGGTDDDPSQLASALAFPSASNSRQRKRGLWRDDGAGQRRNVPVAR